MIQRKQTIYLFLIVVLLFVLLFQSLGVFQAETLTGSKQLYVFNLKDLATGEIVMLEWWRVVPMELLNVLTASGAVIAILKYKKRIMQANYCLGLILVQLLWYLSLLVNTYLVPIVKMPFSYSWVNIIPLVIIILAFLARRAILADERLVRAADRLR